MVRRGELELPRSKVSSFDSAADSRGTV